MCPLIECDMPGLCTGTFLHQEDLPTIQSCDVSLDQTDRLTLGS